MSVGVPNCLSLATWVCSLRQRQSRVAERQVPSVSINLEQLDIVELTLSS